MGAKADRARIEKVIAPFRIDRPDEFRLADCDPAATDGIRDKAAAQERLD